jgi:2,3-bisphosphoglycerate-independent phosphoglycerate mutase
MESFVDRICEAQQPKYDDATMKSFVDRICEAQQPKYDDATIEKAVFDNVKNQIENRKERDIILFDIPTTIDINHNKDIRVKKELCKRVFDRIKSMFKDKAKFYVFTFQHSNCSYVE